MSCISESKNILFVDYLSPEGHIHSTRAQIDVLRELGYVIYSVFKEGYIEENKIEGVHVLLEIPKSLYKGIGTSLKSRISYIRILNYIASNLDLDKWSIILNQSYEPISLFIRPIFKQSYIVDHNTVSDLLHPIKRHILKYLNRNYTHIVFNDYMKDAYERNGIHNVVVVPMGMRSICEVKDDSILHDLNIDKEKFVFSPSSSSADNEFITKMCNSAEFNKCLLNNNIKFVVKGKYEVEERYHKNIILIDKYLSQDEYDCLMKSASLVLIAYPQSFQYRVSGVQLECITSNIKCIMSDIPAFRTYEKYYNYRNCFFKNLEELIDLIPLALEEKCETLYNNIEEVTSSIRAWKKILIK